MPTWQGKEFLERVLGRLSEQRCGLPWDFLAIDSGSTDGTREILESWRGRLGVPFRWRGIHQVEFDHGDTRNLLAALSTGELLVYLTQDAIPTGPDWLQRLAANFEDPAVGAAYCRNVARSDCDPLTRILSAGDPGYALHSQRVRLPAAEVYERLGPHERRLLYNFNDVASALRREVWERHPFPRTWFGEDILQARAVLEAGFTIAYDAEAPVEHSHDYDARETRERARIDGRFNAEWLGRICIGARSDVRTLVERLSVEDAQAIERAGYSGEAASRLKQRARELREAAFSGLYEGGQTQKRLPSSGLLARKELRLLFVVHGFPPDTLAGTELYTLNLAKALQARGHTLTILTRAPAKLEPEQGGPADFEISEDEYQGLRVLRMTNRLRNRSLRDSFQDARVEEPFRALLLREKPDLVHFQHLIHSSAGLVHVAQQLGLATVVHCHDYWALCSRVQLIRPDGVRCPSNMGAGCLVCIRTVDPRKLAHIPRLKRVGEFGGGLLDALARGAHRVPLSDSARKRWDGWAEMRERQDYVPQAYAAADLCISPSRFLRQTYLDSGHFEAHRFLYSDNGMPIAHLVPQERLPSADGRVRLGFIGTLVWYKGSKLMLEALVELARSRPSLAGRVSIEVYGDFQPERDEHHAELQALVQQQQLPVHFHGRFDNRQLPAVYRGFDALLVPSLWYENSPITIHEAQQLRTPVITADIGGMAEFVRDGVDGLHFKVGDAASLAAVMARLCEEPGLLRGLAQDFPVLKTIEEDAAEMESRYRALVARRRARKPLLLADLAGSQCAASGGPVEPQGADMLLLRPGGGAFAEYALPELEPGTRLEVSIDVQGLKGEQGVELGGRVLLGERELGTLTLFRANEQDRLERQRFHCSFEAGARLRLECAIHAGGPEAYLRIKRVLVRELHDENS